MANVAGKTMDQNERRRDAGHGRRRIRRGRRDEQGFVADEVQSGHSPYGVLDRKKMTLL